MTLLTGVRRVGLAFTSAGALFLALPPVDLGLLGWVALVPLHFALRDLRPTRAALLGALFGVATSLATFAWIFRFEAFRLHHAIVLGAWLALFPAVLAVVWSRFARDPRALLFVPLAAATLDWVRGHAGFLAFPWATTAQTQHANLPLLQLASVGGEGLVTLVVVAVNVAIALLVDRRPFRRPALGVIAIAAGLHGAGAVALAQPEHGRPMLVAAVQPAILPESRSGAHEEAAFERLAALTREAAAEGAALVVWPETAVRDPERDLATKLRIREVVEETATPVLFGASETEKLGSGPPSADAPSARSFNSAYLMQPGRPVSEPYRKVRLLPFGEYQPLAGTIAWPSWLAPRMFDTAPGDARRALELLPEDEAESAARIEPIICWENLFADDVRETATPAPSMITHLVNDAWFGPTAQPELHSLVSAFRAVENGRAVVVASNTGPSEIIDPRGRVLARTRTPFAPAQVTATIHLEGGMTFYRRAGDLAWFLPAVVAAAGLVCSRKRRVVRSPRTVLPGLGRTSGGPAPS